MLVMLFGCVILVHIAVFYLIKKCGMVIQGKENGIFKLFESLQVLLSVGRRYLGQISEAYNVSIHNRHFKWLNSAKWCLNGQGSNADGYRPIAPKVQILAKLHLKGGSSLRLLSSFSSLYNQIGCKRTTLPHFK